MRQKVLMKLEQLMEKDKDIIVLVGDLGYRLFDKIRERFPDRFYNVGISEQAMIGIAAGLAKEGKKVVAYSITPFLLYRPFEQVFLDICYHKLPIILIGASEGFSYSHEGISHYALHDLTLTLQIPEMNVYTPAEPEEAENFLEEAFSQSSPAYIRLSRITGKTFNYKILEKDGVTMLNKGVDGVVVSIGSISHEVEEAVHELLNENLKLTHIHVGKTKPLSKYLIESIKESDSVVTIEEHDKTLGFGKFLSNYIPNKIMTIGVGNEFERGSGEREYMLKKNKLDVESIAAQLRDIFMISKKNDR